METAIARSEIIRKLDNISNLIGNTPLIRLENLWSDNEVKIFAKAEWFQFGGSTKSRAAFSIIRHAILSGELDENRCLLDASTDNMAIAYATIASKMNIRVKIFMPDSTPKSTVEMLSVLGAEIKLVRTYGNLENLREAVLKFYNNNSDKYFYANQFLNENYWKAHYYSTAEEIIEQTGGEVTHFVSGIGATGTFTGVGRRLKNYNKRLMVVSLYTDENEAGSENWTQIETTKNTSFFDSQLIDYEIPVSFEEAGALAKEIARKEGMVLKPASAANILGALKIAEEINLGTIVTILPG